MTSVIINVNYNIGEILSGKQQGIPSVELQWLREMIDKYKTEIDERVFEATEQLRRAASENPMRWITENVEPEIQHYVRCEFREKPYNVLMRGQGKWKTVSDIGIAVSPPEHVNHKEWLDEWENKALELSAVNMPFYDTHAHYYLDNFRQVREKLMSLMHKSGIARCILPEIDYKSSFKIKELFDKPEYDWISYAFGVHPKHIWKDGVPLDEWNRMDELAYDPKCVAIGEVGLDYSYPSFRCSDRTNQATLFNGFIEIANCHRLPMILHIRPRGEELSCAFSAVSDAIDILDDNPPEYGAVVHCFGGDAELMHYYMRKGVTHFGIGGRICFGKRNFEQAVREMPEKSIILETDAPFVKPYNGRTPNTSLSLLQIAEKVAFLRETTVEHILQTAYNNARNLFGN